MPPPPNLSDAQLAKQAERKAAKLARKAAAATNGPTPAQLAEAERRRILGREWIPIGSGTPAGNKKVKVVTWNMLAQTLIRRDLFPGSDCLRWGDRKPMLQAEMALHANTDVICLQECDRLDDILGSVPDHRPVQARGEGKLHGLVVLYRASRYHVRAKRAIPLDHEELSPQAATLVARRGVSRQTRNMGLIVGLQENEDQKSGIVVVTTHLFWHPKFEYERARQLIVLLRAVRRMQAEEGVEDWPVLLTGDLNTQPAEVTYQMLSNPGAPIDKSLLESFKASRLVHTNVANIGNAAVGMEVASLCTSDTADDDKDEEELPDSDERSIANTRSPTPADGILTLDSLLDIARDLLGEGGRSAYADTEWGTETFAARGGFAPGVVARGGGEPAYTCFTPLFRLTLDYLFVLPSERAPRFEFTSVLAPPATADLVDGLPRKGVSASDHIAVGCEFAW